MDTPRILTTSHGTNRDAFALLDWGLFVSLSLIWGASFLFMAIGLDAFHPGLVTWLRVGFGAAVMALIPRARTTKIADSQDRSRVGILGFVWIALPLTLFPIAQLWIDSAVAGMLNGATPIFTALLATILLRALPGRLQMAGLAVGFVGIVAIALPSTGSGTTAAIGVIMVLIATVCYAVAINMIAPLQQRYGSLPVIARAMWVAAAAVTPFGIYGLTQSVFAWPSLLALLAVGVLGTGVAFVFMGTLSGRVGPTRSAFITYAIPVVAMILGVVFRDEIVAPVVVIGVALVVAGALLASRREV
jgi:drug/metabolite transporter (DMT)-like permease